MNNLKIIGRVMASYGKLLTCLVGTTPIQCEVAGHYHKPDCDLEWPGVGDYVVLDRPDNQGGTAQVLSVLNRSSELARKVAGARSDKQVIAANVDTIFILMSLNHDLNFARLLRYLTIAKESGARVEVVLTKADLMPDAIWVVDEIKSQGQIDQVHVISAYTGQGIDLLKTRLKKHDTLVFIGSSGVGKSTLLNTLLGEDIMSTNGLRNDDKGRHTTTHRQMIKSKDHIWIIDTPGMREIQFTSQTQGLSEAFDDVVSLFEKCRFKDCNHDKEPGCAVKQAIIQGDLSPFRYKEYTKYLKEMARYEAKMRRKARIAKAAK